MTREYLHNPISTDKTQYFIICAEDEGGQLFLERVCYGRSALNRAIKETKYPIIYATKQIKHIDKIAEEILKELKTT
jgi:hypothetical protein